MFAKYPRTIVHSHLQHYFPIPPPFKKIKIRAEVICKLHSALHSWRSQRLPPHPTPHPQVPQAWALDKAWLACLSEVQAILPLEGGRVSRALLAKSEEVQSLHLHFSITGLNHQAWVSQGGKRASSGSPGGGATTRMFREACAATTLPGPPWL